MLGAAPTKVANIRRRAPVSISSSVYQIVEECLLVEPVPADFIKKVNGSLSRRKIEKSDMSDGTAGRLRYGGVSPPSPRWTSSREP